MSGKSRERAKARQDVGRPKTGEVKENFPQDNTGQSRDIAAKKLGMSGKSRERAKARQAENAKTNNPNIKNPENLPDSVKGDSRDIAAKKLGMSGKCMVCISKFKGYELTPLNSWW